MAYSEEIGRMGTSAKKKDGTGYANYKEAADANSVIEEKIGLSLAKSGQLLNVAKNIAEKSKVPVYAKAHTTAPEISELSEAGKDKIDGEADTFGGARGVKEGWETLGAYTFRVMNEIEKDKGTKSKYSQVQAGNTANPYFGNPGEKKPEFDKPISTLSFVDLPTTAQTYLTQKATAPLPPNASGLSFNYDGLDPNAKFAILKDYRYQNEAAQATAKELTTQLQKRPPIGINMRPITIALNNLNHKTPNEAAARTTAILVIKATMGTTDRDDAKAQLGALLDIVVDKHTSGDNTNMVKKGNNPLNPHEDKWIDDTVAAGKPIISGPSGHTLRYLNFWAEKRKQEKERAGGNINGWPSLEAARLVMMANLMPPKHHSYDEIMTSSIGIKDEIKPPLLYKHKSSYLDLATHQETDAKKIALNAYVEAEAGKVKTDKSTDKRPEGYDKEKEQRHIQHAIQRLAGVLNDCWFSDTTYKAINDAIIALNTEKDAAG